MKKVLFISPSPLSKVGGIETYEKYLIEIIKKEYPDCLIDIVVYEYNRVEENISNDIIYHFCFLDTLSEQSSYLRKFLNVTKKFKLTRKYVYQLHKKNNYDLIIDSSFIYFKKFNSLNNYFLIQHFHISNYIYSLYKKDVHRKYIDDLFQVLILHKTNTLKKMKNLVVFDDLNAKEAKKYTNANVWIIPLCGYDNFGNNLNSYNFENRNKIIYFGRINENQKRISSLIKINDDLLLIDFYGNISISSDAIFLEIIKNKRWFHGQLNKGEAINILNQYKFSILYSNYEGFPFSLVESLSCGVPIIVKDTFLSASYLCNKNTGLLLDKNNSIEKDIELIKSFYDMDYDNYKKLCISCLDFYKKNLSYQNFSKRWNEVLNIFLKE